jgi:hypothetical protein
VFAETPTPYELSATNWLATISQLKNPRRLIMKTILSAILALSVLTGVAASAYAFDAKTFYEEQDRESH